MKKIFVVGCPRSGTTLVQQLLATRDDIYTCTETHYFQRIRRRKWRKIFDYFLLSRDNVLDAYDYIRSNNELHLQHDLGGIRSFRAAVLFLDQLMTSEAQIRGKHGWVEKTPMHLFYARLIKRYISSAQFVHVLRDGRDVIASMVDASKKFPEASAWKSNEDLNGVIQLYNRFLKESLKYYAHKSHIFLRYENIIEDPDQARTDLFTALHLENSYRSIELGDVHKKIVRSDEGWKNNYENKIVDTRLIKYKQIFTREQQEFIVYKLSKIPTDLVLI